MDTVADYGPAPIDVAHAYPGTWPDRAVVVDGDRVVPLPRSPHGTDGRTPIVAIGSNACPAQIHAKTLGGPVVLTPTVLRDHLVVYAGHMTSYGAIPATVTPWPGASCAVFVSWLTDDQHAVMDTSEGPNYERVQLPTDDGPLPGYRARTGLTTAGSRPIRVAGITADGPDLPDAMTQPEVLAHVLG
ncbi:hypothetical protein [Euzebya sp.]|uniref:hypothetical protein n=1 Tax=Euzebya sp. TaxID=1971409 RepID=UPI0035194851